MAKAPEAKLEMLNTDMKEDMLQELGALVEEEFAHKKSARESKAEYQTLIAKSIKTAMEKKYGCTWHCAIGKNFGADIRYESSHIAYMKRGDDFILLWKAG